MRYHSIILKEFKCHLISLDELNALERKGGDMWFFKDNGREGMILNYHLIVLKEFRIIESIGKKGDHFETNIETICIWNL